MSLSAGGAIALLAAASPAVGAPPPDPPGAAAQAAPGARVADAYTRYELLAPGSGAFRILYDVLLTGEGRTLFFNPIRPGSLATDESVIDLSTGAPLAFKLVSGREALAEGLQGARPDDAFIRVELARPIPAGGGEARVRILKTYADPKSYRAAGDSLDFQRSLGIKRNAVVLPPGYALATCNVPVQIALEADGRMRASFLNDTPAEAPLHLSARRAALAGAPATTLDPRFDERARQTRDIVYSLREPDTHAFDLFHDYTEDRVGTDHYLNVVRQGSTVSAPSGRILDTGAEVPARIISGAAIAELGLKDPDLPAAVPGAQVVVFTFPPVRRGESVRLRMSETYTDPGGYRRVGDDLVFERTFGRPRNAVILPMGWVLTNVSAPAAISTTADGRTRLDFTNPRPDELHVLLTARRLAP